MVISGAPGMLQLEKRTTGPLSVTEGAKVTTEVTEDGACQSSSYEGYERSSFRSARA